MEKIRCYSELVLLPTFEERFQYLRLDGVVGQETFGFDRYMNQYFYRSKEWRRVRDIVIARDAGCDLGVPGHEISDPSHEPDQAGGYPESKRHFTQSGVSYRHRS